MDQSNIKDFFPNGMRFVELEDKVKIYREGPILSSWQIVLPKNSSNRDKLKAICLAVNLVVEAPDA